MVDNGAIKIGRLISKGPTNLITDVEGISVGHVTIRSESINTGVTAIVPSEGNVFKSKLVASSHVINGFGKSTGLLQVDELGTLETPIILTNTLNVGTGFSALVKYMLKENPDIGITTGTLNPVVCECNDGKINDIRSMALTEEDMILALENAERDFPQGDHGAGAGMVCYGLKGGIGSSSRILKIGHENFTLGVLVLSNFGSTEDLLYYGAPLGKEIESCIASSSDSDKGSIIVVLATDIPLTANQIKRALKRIQSGIARTGSYTGNGSGEVAIGFSTANRVEHYPKDPFKSFLSLNDDYMDIVFLATVQATEEAVLNSMLHAGPSVSRTGAAIHSLAEFKDILD